MRENELTARQIFWGIKRMLAESFDLQDPFSSSTRVDHYLQDWWDDLDLLDLVFNLERVFGCQIPRNEWWRFWGADYSTPEEWEREVGPRLTIDHLVEFIRAHITPISVEPVTMLGKSCESATAFRIIEEIIESITPGHTRFRPRTPIRTALKDSEEAALWTRLQWMTLGELPARHWSLLNRIAFVTATTGIIGIFLSILVGIWVNEFRTPAAVCSATIITVVGFLGCLFMRPVLPKDVTTFRDLAKRVAPFLELQTSSG